MNDFTRENIIDVVGHTVIDALHDVVGREACHVVDYEVFVAVNRAVTRGGVHGMVLSQVVDVIDGFMS